MSDKSSNWVTSTGISKLKNYFWLVPIFQSNIEKDSYPKDIATDSYKNVMYHWTNLPFMLKLLNLYFVFGCLVLAKWTKMIRNHRIKICQNLLWVTASLHFTKGASFSCSTSHIHSETGTSQLVIYPVVNKYFKKELFPFLEEAHIISKSLYYF